MAWRWDQGRLQYFQFDAIRKIAACLSELDAVPLDSGLDPLRTPLRETTGLPFAPANYTVWRNYGRVFGCQLLAARVANRLACTQLCLDLARSDGRISTADDYLAHLSKKFYYPSPVFDGYDPSADQVFPFCAVLKLLVSQAVTQGITYITLSDVFEKLIGNQCTGKEPLSRYAGLSARPVTPSADEERQVRELIIFLSQFSFLKWQNPRLFLDVSSVSKELSEELTSLATPMVEGRNPDRGQEVLSLGKLPGSPVKVPEMKDRIYSEDIEFLEGRKVRVTHLRSERSRKLRDLFFRTLSPPYSCDMCSIRTRRRYPWTDNLLEVHHLLPLSSPIKVESGKTSVKDLVGLCPNCHKATHAYYRKWLTDRSQDDFATYAEARAVYKQATEGIVLP